MERSQLDKQFLDYILDDLMPWHCDANMNLLEVNQYVCAYVKVVRGVYGLR